MTSALAGTIFSIMDVGLARIRTAAALMAPRARTAPAGISRRRWRSNQDGGAGAAAGAARGGRRPGTGGGGGGQAPSVFILGGGPRSKPPPLGDLFVWPGGLPGGCRK